VIRTEVELVRPTVDDNTGESFLESAI